MDILNKRIVVTGAASGIGKALCIAFKEAGAKSIVCVDMNIDGARETADTIRGLAVAADVSNEQDIINVISEANELSGGIDIFVLMLVSVANPVFLKPILLIGIIFGV